MKKKVLYVGGLDESITEEILHAAFVPFGDLQSIEIPRDFKDNKKRGYAFVEFELENDCLDALENMDGAELFGKTLRCAIAKPNSNVKIKAGQAMWTAEQYFKNSNDDAILEGNGEEEDV